jgi:hypothetical protein
MVHEIAVRTTPTGARVTFTTLVAGRGSVRSIMGFELELKASQTVASHRVVFSLHKHATKKPQAIGGGGQKFYGVCFRPLLEDLMIIVKFDKQYKTSQNKIFQNF